MQKRFQFGLGAFFAILATLHARPASALLAASYDLDSLAYLSTYVAEGEVVKTAPDFKSVDLKINAVYAGDLAVGATVTIFETDWYVIPSHGGRLQPGDKIFVFLAKTKPNQWWGQGLPIGTLIAVESGVKLIDDGKVHGFEWGMGFEEVTRERNPRVKIPDVADFRRDLLASIKRAKEWKLAWTKPPTAAEISALVLMLKERRDIPSDATHADAICACAANRLAWLLDVPSIFEGLESNPNEAPRLLNGCNSPEGKEFLLKKLADPATSATTKKILARDLCADYPYTSRMVQKADGSLTLASGPPNPNNGDYLKRCALLAIATKGSPEISDCILAKLEFASRWFDRDRDPGIRVDLANVVKVLTPYYAGDSSETAKYLIEQIIRNIDPDAYAGLGSKDGGIIAIVKLQPPDEYDSWAKAPGHLSLSLGYEWPRGFDGIDSMQLVMESSKDKAIYHLEDGDFTPQEHGERDQDCGAGIRATLPANLPRGSYHVFYQLKKKGALVGRTFGFDLNT